IYVETTQPAEVSAVELRLGSPGGDVQIYSAPGATSAPTELDGWTPVGQAPDVGTNARISLSSSEASEFYLVWFTKLPTEDSGELKAEVSDIRLIATD